MPVSVGSSKAKPHIESPAYSTGKAVTIALTGITHLVNIGKVRVDRTGEYGLLLFGIISVVSRIVLHIDLLEHHILNGFGVQTLKRKFKLIGRCVIQREVGTEHLRHF